MRLIIPADTPTERLLTITELSEFWSVSQRYIRKEIDEGRLGCTDMGRKARRSLRIPVSEANKYAAARTIAAKVSA